MPHPCPNACRSRIHRLWIGLAAWDTRSCRWAAHWCQREKASGEEDARLRGAWRGLMVLASRAGDGPLRLLVLFALWASGPEGARIGAAMGATALLGRGSIER